MASRVKNVLGNLMLVVMSSVLILVIADLILRVVIHPGDFKPARMSPDPVLGHRVEPLTTLHDAFGFRNRGVPKQAEPPRILRRLLRLRMEP